MSDHSMLDRWSHIEPRLYAAMDLHTAVNKLEDRIWRAKLIFPPKTEATEQSA